MGKIFLEKSRKPTSLTCNVGKWLLCTTGHAKPSSPILIFVSHAFGLLKWNSKIINFNFCLTEMTLKVSQCLLHLTKLRRIVNLLSLEKICLQQSSNEFHQCPFYLLDFHTFFLTFIQLTLRPAYKGKNALWSAQKLRSSSTLQYLPFFHISADWRHKIEFWTIVTPIGLSKTALSFKRDLNHEWKVTTHIPQGALLSPPPPKKKERNLLEFSQCCKDLEPKICE